MAVLDAGCGHGNYVIDENRSKIAFACGVDASKKATGKNICLGEIRYADLARIPYEDKTFDIVLSLWVIEHLNSPKKVFLEMYRVLKPGGYLLFAIPNKNCLLLLARRLVGNSRFVTEISSRLYGRKDEDMFPAFYKANTIPKLKDLLKQCCFEKIDLKLNYDPSYTSFSKATFKLSNFLNTVFEKFAPRLYKQHIVGVVRKPLR